MQTIYVVAVWLHILAAVLWVGGMAFLVLILAPLLRRLNDDALAADLLHRVGSRLRPVGWACLAMLVATGLCILAGRGVTLADVTGGSFWSSPFGQALRIKLIVVLVILVVSAAHDFGLGPIAENREGAHAGFRGRWSLRRLAAWTGRANFILGLLAIALGVTLVRGWPW